MLARSLASSAASPDETMLLPSGPRIARIACSSLLRIALRSAALASVAEANIFGPWSCAIATLVTQAISIMGATAEYNFARHIGVFSMVIDARHRALRRRREARRRSSHFRVPRNLEPLRRDR